MGISINLTLLYHLMCLMVVIYYGVLQSVRDGLPPLESN